MSNPLLNISNLACKIAGSHILDQVNLTVTEAETVGIIGPNGSGKTTFFNCLSGFNQISKGEIFFEGCKIDDKAPYLRARLGIGRIFQNFGIFREMTLLENMLLALEGRTAGGSKEVKEKALSYLAQVNLAEKSLLLASSLSGGQMRLLEIVRTVAMGAKLFLFDEPTAGVAPKLREQLAEKIAQISAGGATVLIIEHDINFIQKFCHRIIVFNQGKIALDGEAQAVRDNPLLKEIYFGGK
jgi:ABC-type branched-subunit amino acid transport system ATPase component